MIDMHTFINIRNRCMSCRTRKLSTDKGNDEQRHSILHLAFVKVTRRGIYRNCLSKEYVEYGNSCLVDEYHAVNVIDTFNQLFKY